MNRLGRYLSWLFIQRVFVVSLAMVVLLGVLDALSNTDLLPEGATFQDSMRYMILRLPVLFERTVTFALLLGVMLTYLTLIKRNELVPVWGSGLSVFGQIRVLTPAAVLVGLLAAIIIDQTIPPAQRALENWLGTEILNQDSQAPQSLWLAEDQFLIEIEHVNDTSLKGLTMFERAEAGRIASVSRAKTGKLTDEGWVLNDVTQIRYDKQEPKPPTLWTTSLGPHILRQLLSEPRNISARDLYYLSGLERSGNRPSSAYLVWFYGRVLLPVIAVGFLILSLPLMQKFGRNDRAEFTLVLGMIIGFVYLVTDGVFKSLAESGAISAFIATAIPVIGLYTVGLTLTAIKTHRT